MGWQESGNKFINPYNFVSNSEECKKNINILDEVKKGNKLTGYIECKIKTKTPVFIPNTSSDKVFSKASEKHKTYDFFSYNDLSHPEKHELNKSDNFDSMCFEPVIPGSSIRGVIRSAYETVTNSCMSVIDDQSILYKRLPDPGKPAVLVKHTDKIGKRITLESAIKYMAKYKECKKDPAHPFPIKDYKECQKVYFKPGNRYEKNIRGKIIKLNYTVTEIKKVNCKEENGYKEGYILKGEEINGKHHFSIFEIDKNRRKPIATYRYNSQSDIDNESDLKRLLYVIKLYGDKRVNGKLVKGMRQYHNEEKEHFGYREYEKELEKLLNTDDNEELIIPVFYKEINGVRYLSPACITKEVYKNTIESILRNKGGFDPCTDIKNLCPACALFGMVNIKSTEKVRGKEEYPDANSSRLRFTDGRIENFDRSNASKYYENIVTLKELASPKISATEFYLERPLGEDYWTYDYAFCWNNYNKDCKADYEPELRGRKYYWHNNNFIMQNVSTEELTERNITVHPVKKDIEFEFKVYFDRITEEELKKLIWVLNIGDNNSSNCYKIGMAKPLGLGSIKISVNQVKIRRLLRTKNSVKYEMTDFDKSLNYKYDESILHADENVLKQFKKITNFNNGFENNICYPLGHGKGDNKNTNVSHQWFIGNKSMKLDEKNRKGRIPEGKGTSPVVKYTLPHITDKYVTLPELKI